MAEYCFETCVEMELDCEDCKTADGSKSAVMPGSVSWVDTAWIVKWTLKNVRHLELDDKYLIEKEVDRCHSELMQLKNG